MTGLFYSVLETSFYGSIVIALVLALRLILKKAPRSVICLLWLLVGLRLVCPFTIESSLSLQPQVSHVSNQVSSIRQENQTQTNISVIPNADSNLSDGESTPSNAVPEDTAGWPEDVVISVDNTVTVTPSGEPDIVVIDYGAILAGIWLAGMAVLAVYTVISYLRLKRQVSAGSGIGGDISVCPGIESAFILGFLKPRIYLPQGLSQESRSYVLAHERAHIARKDHIWKLLGFGVLTIHWFNPLVWLAYSLLCRDIEMACDERVIRDMDSSQRKAYSTALLSCAAKRSGISACPVAFGEVSVKQRIVSVLNYRKPGFWITVVALAAVILVVVCFMTGPESGNLAERLEILPEGISEVTIYTENGICTISSEGEVGKFAVMLESVDCDTVSPTEKTAFVSVTTGGTPSLTFYISQNFDYVWTDDGAYSIDEPEIIREYISQQMNPVTDRTATAQPFATAQQGQQWASGISMDAVESAQLKIVYTGGNTSTNGYMTQGRVEALIQLLNALPEEAFVSEETLEDETFSKLSGYISSKGGVAVSIFDGANDLAAVLRKEGSGSVKLILCGEMYKVNDGFTYMDVPCWTIEDDGLKAWMQELWDHPDIIYWVSEPQSNAQGTWYDVDEETAAELTAMFTDTTSPYYMALMDNYVSSEFMSPGYFFSQQIEDERIPLSEEERKEIYGEYWYVANEYVLDADRANDLLNQVFGITMDHFRNTGSFEYLQTLDAYSISSYKFDEPKIRILQGRQTELGAVEIIYKMTSRVEQVVTVYPVGDSWIVGSNVTLADYEAYGQDYSKMEVPWEVEADSTYEEYFSQVRSFTNSDAVHYSDFNQDYVVESDGICWVVRQRTDSNDGRDFPVVWVVDGTASNSQILFCNDQYIYAYKGHNELWRVDYYSNWEKLFVDETGILAEIYGGNSGRRMQIYGEVFYFVAGIADQPGEYGIYRGYIPTGQIDLIWRNVNTSWSKPSIQVVYSNFEVCWTQSNQEFWDYYYELVEDPDSVLYTDPKYEGYSLTQEGTPSMILADDIDIDPSIVCYCNALTGYYYEEVLGRMSSQLSWDEIQNQGIQWWK